MINHSQRLVKLSELLTPHLLNMQDMDKDSDSYGDVIQRRKGFGEAITLHIPVTNFVGMYFHPDSSRYMDESLLKRAQLVIDVLIKGMHEDGTCDLLETNFHDATVVAFYITPLAYVYRLIQKRGNNTQAERVLQEKLLTLFKKGAEGMRNGGFHTPNHRWVMAAALSLMGNILDDEIYKDEARKYLGEGIDCDEEGEYTERSVAIYDITVNESLIVIAQELDMPELYEYVARNLKKNFAYLDPDGTICTLNSRRQDNSTKYFPLRHYWSYLYLAYHYNTDIFAGVAEHLISLMEKRAYELPGYALVTGGKEDVHNPIVQYLLHDYLNEDAKGDEIKWNGHWYFAQNGIVRHRHENTSVTLLRDREVFLQYKNGENTLTAKIASCFFGKGYFKAKKIEKTQNGYRMSLHQEWGYKRPLEGIEPNSKWFDLPHEKRDNVHMQPHDIIIDVAITYDEVNMRVQMTGVKNVPLKIEFMLSPGGTYSNSGIMMNPKAGDSLIQKSDSATYDIQGDIIKIQNGAFAHCYTSEMRATAPASNNHFTVYMTGYTPFDHNITISSDQ